jgi:hypothetical protein
MQGEEGSTSAARAERSPTFGGASRARAGRRVANRQSTGVLADRGAWSKRFAQSLLLALQAFNVLCGRLGSRIPRVPLSSLT